MPDTPEPEAPNKKELMELAEYKKAVERFLKETDRKIAKQNTPSKGWDPGKIVYNNPILNNSPKVRPASKTEQESINKLLFDPTFDYSAIRTVIESPQEPDPNLKPVNVKITFDPDKIFRINIQKDKLTVYLPPGILTSVSHLNQRVLKDCSKYPLQGKNFLTERLPFTSLISKISCDPDALPICKHLVVPDSLYTSVDLGLKEKLHRNTDTDKDLAYESCSNEELIALTSNPFPQCTWGAEMFVCPYYEPTVPKTYDVTLSKWKDKTNVKATLVETPVHVKGMLSYTLKDENNKSIFEEGSRWVDEPLESMVERLAQTNLESLKETPVSPQPEEAKPPFLSDVV